MGFYTPMHRELERLGWNQARLAEYSGVNAYTVSQFYRGHAISGRNVEAIAQAMGFELRLPVDVEAYVADCWTEVEGDRSEEAFRKFRAATIRELRKAGYFVPIDAAGAPMSWDSFE